MKKEKIKTNMEIQLSVIPWILMYPLIGQLIKWRINDLFLYLAEENAVIISTEKYLQSVNTTLIIAASLSLLWWFLACNRGMLRKIVEEYTILFTVAFIFCMCVAVAFISADMMILDDLGKKYEMLMEWSVLGGFAFNLFLFSPQNIRRMVFLKGRLGSGLMATLFMIFSIFCLWRGMK